MPKILIIEDDVSNNRMVQDYLEHHGYLCTPAYSGSEGKLLFSMEQYDLVLLDLMLPGICGEELVTQLSKQAPVIVLSAKSGLDSKVEVLSAGADDYMCKPFDLPELLVRIQVQLRRRNQTVGQCPTEHAIVYRAWVLNPDTQEMTAEGELVGLTKHEFQILELFMRNPKKVFSRQMIYEYVWGEEYLAEDKTIHVHISNIRSKLKKSGTDTYIQTVWGMGFKLS